MHIAVLLLALINVSTKIGNTVYFLHIFLSSEVLKEAGKLCPKMLAAEIEGVKHKHRTKKYCDELLKVITSFS
jgi:hypothetical protein